MLSEGFTTTTTDNIDDWERVLGIDNKTLPIEVRRAELLKKQQFVLTTAQIALIAESYGASFQKLTFPYSPAFFGFSHFNCRLSIPAGWSFIRLYMSAPPEIRVSLEESITAVLLAHHLSEFRYI